MKTSNEFFCCSLFIVVVVVFYVFLKHNKNLVPVLQHMLRNLQYIADEKRMYSLSLAIEKRGEGICDMSALENWERDGDGRTVLVTATLVIFNISCFFFGLKKTIQ